MNLHRFLKTGLFVPGLPEFDWLIRLECAGMAANKTRARGPALVHSATSAR